MGQSLSPGYDLIITNGDSAGELLRKAIANTEVMPWRDVLHDGPVPLTGDDDELSELRADYLADKRWGDHDELREAFRARDRGLAHHETFKRVMLWFEHDLYDQLQLIQILAWFAANPREDGALFLLQSDDFLGTQEIETLSSMQGSERPVTPEQLELAVHAWDAFRQSTPEAWAGLLDDDLAMLPFLKPAVRRMLEELPDTKSGLSRTQRTILQQIEGGVTRPGALFGAVQKTEQAAFMGDWSFWDRLDGLADANAPLIDGFDEGPFTPSLDGEDFKAYLSSELRLTALGKKVLAGEEDYLRHIAVEGWFGGTRLADGDVWRWDQEKARLVAPGATA